MSIWVKCDELNNIHALQGVHGVQHRQALHGVLSFLPHQRGQQVPELQRGPGKEKEIKRVISSYHTKSQNKWQHVGEAAEDGCILKLTGSPLAPGSPLGPEAPWSPCGQKHTHVL